MFEEWRRVWRETVENFQQQLEEGDESAPAGSRESAMRHDVGSARAELKKLEADVARAERLAKEERTSENDCNRRRTLAEKINDPETARLAAEFAERHAARAVILERKVEILGVERAMRLQDLHAMESALSEFELNSSQAAADLDAAAGADGRSEADSAEQPRRRPPVSEDEEFNARKMQREARERAADARLEELKKKMNRS
jgi:hypothetical protein